MAHELALADNERDHTVEKNLRRLLVAHRDEWNAFVGAQGAGSFLAQWMSELR